MDNKAIAKNIKTNIQESGFTLSEVEKALGFSPGLISRWGKSLPTLDRVISIAEYINMSLNELVGFELQQQDTTNNYDLVVDDLIAKTNNDEINWTSYTNISKCPLYNNLEKYYYASGIDSCDSYEIYTFPYMNGYIIITASIYEQYDADLTSVVEFIIIADETSEGVVRTADDNKLHILWNILHLKYFGKFDKDKSDDLIRNYIINESFKENSNYETSIEEPMLVHEDSSSYSAFNDSDIENLQEVITKLEDSDVRDVITQIYDNKKFIKRMLAYYTRFQKLNKSKGDKEQD